MDRGGISSELILEKILKLINYYYYDEESQELPAAERHFQSLAGPINVSVDLKYDILCL